MRGVVEFGGHAGALEIDEAGPVRRRADEHFGAEPEGDPVGLDEARGHGLDRARLDQTHRAAAETAAGHARPVHAREALRVIGEEVDLRAGDRKVVAHRGLRSVHRRAAGSKVAGLQRPLGFEHARVLGDDVAAAAIDEVGQGATMPLEIGWRDVAQRRYRSEMRLQEPHAFLAGGAPVVVFAAGMLVADVGVGDDQPKIGRDRDGARFQRPAVDQERVAGDAAGGDILIHDAAAHADEFVFRALGDPGRRYRLERKA